MRCRSASPSRYTAGTIPHGSAITATVPAVAKQNMTACVIVRNCDLFIPGLLKLDVHFQMCRKICFAIANPDCVESLPVAERLNREPRSCHKVHAFNSQSTPQLIPAHTLHRPTGNQFGNAVFL